MALNNLTGYTTTSIIVIKKEVVIAFFNTLRPGHNSALFFMVKRVYNLESIELGLRLALMSFPAFEELLFN